jgi:hypothetical protein
MVDAVVITEAAKIAAYRMYSCRQGSTVHVDPSREPAASTGSGHGTPPTWQSSSILRPPPFGGPSRSLAQLVVQSCKIIKFTLSSTRRTSRSWSTIARISFGVKRRMSSCVGLQIDPPSVKHGVARPSPSHLVMCEDRHRNPPTRRDSRTHACQQPRSTDPATPHTPLSNTPKPHEISRLRIAAHIEDQLGVSRGLETSYRWHTTLWTGCRWRRLPLSFRGPFGSGAPARQLPATAGDEVRAQRQHQREPR